MQCEVSVRVLSTLKLSVLVSGHIYSVEVRSPAAELLHTGVLFKHRLTGDFSFPLSTDEKTFVAQN